MINTQELNTATGVKTPTSLFFWLGRLRLSPTSDPYGHPNPKWVTRDPKSASNRLPVWETHFRLSERHNPNMNIFFFLLKTHLQKGFSFGHVVGEDAK
jgi:hypothetical protein